MSKEIPSEVIDLIKGFTLENIEKFSKANPNAILGKILGTNPNLKSKIPELLKEIRSIITKFSKLSKKEFKEQHKKYTAHIERPTKQKRTGLPELKEIDKKYAFRFAPSPSGGLHIGHAIPLLLNSEYAKKYKGKFILRIEDTNPANIYPEAYKLIKKDADWITKNNVSQLIIQSEKIPIYYKYAEQLIKLGQAYVCSCPPEKWRDFVSKKSSCPHHNQDTKTNKQKWEEMHSSLSPGSAVLRIKTDMKHKNPALRDWPAFRITDDEHPVKGKKYKVWPLMNFSVAVDDHESELTHIIRGKDHLTNAERQKYIYNYFKWWIPEFIHTGRINFEGINISATEFKNKIQEKKYSGWDDPKLPTLTAFKRRGLQPEAFIKYIQEIGPSKVDKTVSYEDFMTAIYSFNRTIIEPKANRYFIIEDPIELEINNLPKTIKAEIPLHPDFPKRGKRNFHKSNKFYIEKKDKPLKSKNYRLMNLCNFSGKDLKFLSHNLEPKLKTKIMHWLPKTTKEKPIKVLVKMSHGKDIQAIGEPALKYLKPNTIIQFERKFFARYDSVEKDIYTFYFTHK
jgi:glutamyl-tRNA synthetase